MTDELEMRYLNDPDYDSFPMRQRLEECVNNLILKNLEFEDLQCKSTLPYSLSLFHPCPTIYSQSLSLLT